MVSTQRTKGIFVCENAQNSAEIRLLLKKIRILPEVKKHSYGPSNLSRDLILLRYIKIIFFRCRIKTIFTSLTIKILAILQDPLGLLCVLECRVHVTSFRTRVRHSDQMAS